MEVRFHSRELQRTCNQRSALDARWGLRAGSALAQTLHELQALERLGDVAKLPYIQLRAGKDGVVVLESIGGVRVRMLASAEAGGEASSWKACERVVIVGVEFEK